jgi:hypothetical protein
MRMITLSFAALLALGSSAVFAQQTPEAAGVGSPPAAAAPPSAGVPIVGAAPPVGVRCFQARIGAWTKLQKMGFPHRLSGQFPAA